MKFLLEFLQWLDVDSKQPKVLIPRFSISLGCNFVLLPVQPATTIAVLSNSISVIELLLFRAPSIVSLYTKAVLYFLFYRYCNLLKNKDNVYRMYTRDHHNHGVEKKKKKNPMKAAMKTEN